MEKGFVLSPSNEVINKIRAELSLNENQIKESVESLKKWLELQPHLPKDPAVTDERRLENWLIRCKNSMERVKQSLDLYYSLRNIAPELMCDWDPYAQWFQSVHNHSYGITLPDLTPDCDRVCVVGLLDPEISLYEPHDSLKTVLMGLEIRMCEDYFLKDILIVDFKHATIGHTTKYPLPLMKKFLTCIMKAYCWRIRAVHFINVPSYAEVPLNIVKSVMKKKLQDRVHVYGTDLTELYKHVPKHILPTELGGGGSTIMEYRELWMIKFRSYRDWFLKQNQLKSDDSKRPTGKINSSDVFGFEGSFRQLSID